MKKSVFIVLGIFFSLLSLEVNAQIRQEFPGVQRATVASPVPDIYKYCDKGLITLGKFNPGVKTNLHYNNQMNMYLLSMKMKRELNKKMNIEVMYLMASASIVPDRRPMDFLQLKASFRLAGR